jgi:AcrR family transcriptional regulator
MKTPLTRARILEGALAIVDREGLQALTMRRLGQDLGVEAMSIYRHIENKDAVFDGIVELIILEIDVPADPDLDWEEAVRRVARSYRQAALAHPNAFPLVTTRPLSTVEALKRVNAFFELQRRAGFDERSTLASYRMLSAYIRGFALEEVTGRALSATPDRASLDQWTRDFPSVAELAPLLADPDPDADFERGLDMVVSGMRAELVAGKPSPKRASAGSARS